jgi:hypothetical protein
MTLLANSPDKAASLDTTAASRLPGPQHAAPEQAPADTQPALRMPQPEQPPLPRVRLRLDVHEPPPPQPQPAALQEEVADSDSSTEYVSPGNSPAPSTSSSPRVPDSPATPLHSASSQLQPASEARAASPPSGGLIPPVLSTVLHAFWPRGKPAGHAPDQAAGDGGSPRDLLDRASSALLKARSSSQALSAPPKAALALAAEPGKAGSGAVAADAEAGQERAAADIKLVTVSLAVEEPPVSCSSSSSSSGAGLLSGSWQGLGFTTARSSAPAEAEATPMLREVPALAQQPGLWDISPEQPHARQGAQAPPQPEAYVEVGLQVRASCCAALF